MTKDDIIRMVKEADDAVCFEEDEQAFYEHFAALVAAAEREACAVTCEDIYNDPKGNDGNDCYYTRPYLECAEAIRARSQS